MAIFTDIFIKKPVLAIVISLLIFVVGLRSAFDLQLRQFPKLENTVITVTTGYPGASAQTIEGFITRPLEKEVASAEGVDYISSESHDGYSVIKAYILLNFDSNIAFSNVLSKVQEAKKDLPKEASSPVLQKETGSNIGLMYLGFSSSKMTPEQIGNYLSLVVQPKLESIPGVAQAIIMGSQTYAMRIWLDINRMAGLSVTANDVYSALANNNVQAAAGHTRGKYIEISINPKTDVQSEDDFKNIVVKRGEQGALVRIKDVARVELGSVSYDSSVYFNSKKAVFMEITSSPLGNPLTVASSIRKILPDLEANFPPTLKADIVYDATKFIRASIKEVVRTILEAALIVIIVIYLFLGSLRTVMIPVVTIPLSLIGVCILMRALGYSINLLTLLAMVLAIGMVVDDAIVVVENIYRHIEEGMKSFQAALQGAREIALPIISMTITLAAVYAPIGFMGGLTGALFKEFAFTLASTVIISGIVALTLSPMMCSKILSDEIGKLRFVAFVDEKFHRLKVRYQNSLHSVLNYRTAMIAFSMIVLISCIFLYMNSSKELAPQEDQGVIFVSATGPQIASLKYMEKFTNEFNPIYQSIPGRDSYFTINGMGTTNNVFSAIILKPWGERSETSDQVNKKLQEKFGNVAGLQIQSFGLPPLPTGGDPIPVQFIITSIQPFNTIYPVMENMVTQASRSGLFMFIIGTLKFDKPQVQIQIDRNKAAQLGVDMQTIATALATDFGGNDVNSFNIQGRGYKVIPQAEQRYQLNPEDLTRIYLNTASGKLVPLSVLTNIKYQMQPNSLTHFQQFNSATLMGMMMPGHTIGEGLDYLKGVANKIFTSDLSYDFAGQSRQYIQEGGALVYTFFFSIIVIFLVLAAQFESFRDPLIIMISVPMAICGALLPINWGLASINIYTQVGLITLIGLISKHGILMVDFANQIRQSEGLSRREAIEKAAAIRLRPILMTTFAIILGVVPLLTAAGAGSMSRYDIGLVIAAGMAIGTLFTLFVVPTMYTLKTKQILLFLLAVIVISYLIYYVISLF